MKNGKIFLSAMLSFSLITITALPVSALADNGKHMGQRHDFTRDVTRTNGAGKTITSHTEQVVSDTGFVRTTDKSGPNGQTAHREVAGTRSTDGKSFTKTVEGTRLNGKTYSGSATTTRTEDGYERHSTATNGAGKTATRDVVVDVDKANHTLTKERTSVGFNGKTHSSTVVKTIGGGQ